MTVPPVDEKQGISNIVQAKQKIADVEFGDASTDTTEEGCLQYDKAERNLVRKLDFLYVMPFVSLLFFLQFLDKATLNYSGVLGIKEDTGTTGSQFSWLGSFFYLGYLLYQIPNQFLLQRFPVSKLIGTSVMIWGGVLAAMFGTKSFAELAGLRFLLGFFEASMYPGCILVISTMYRRREHAPRIGMMYISNCVALGFGGFIGYGIGETMDGVRGHAAWKWLMLILGVITIAIGAAVFFLLIDNPRSRFLRLTEEQKVIVEDRLRDNAVVVSKKLKYYQILEALKEPRYYCFSIASLLVNLQNGGITTFSSIITAGFGFSGVDSILLSVPSGVVAIVFLVTSIWLNRKYGHTLYIASIMLIISMIGLILLITIPTPKARLIGIYLSWGYPSSCTMFLTSIANNVSGYTKKIFYSISYVIFYTIGSFAGPLMMVDSQAPLYLGGMIGYIAADGLCILAFLYARHLMAKSNEERLARGIVESQGEDITDREDPNFIYRL
ncbi:major facilitator superfamily domain-containing protein [Dichotomocladium elegans]|nr:major facilitator superfamily domain-containing protein [Dichotomocladium elegans]